MSEESQERFPLEMQPEDAKELQRIFEEVMRHQAKVERRLRARRIKHGKAAKKAQQEQ